MKSQNKLVADLVQLLAVVGHALDQVLHHSVLHSKNTSKNWVEKKSIYLSARCGASGNLDQKRSLRARLFPYSCIALMRSCFTVILFIAIPPWKSGAVEPQKWIVDFWNLQGDVVASPWSVGIIAPALGGKKWVNWLVLGEYWLLWMECELQMFWLLTKSGIILNYWRYLIWMDDGYIAITAVIFAQILRPEYAEYKETVHTILKENMQKEPRSYRTHYII